MRVLFISRATLYTVKGGDTVQMLNTASALRKLGVEVDIALSDEIIDYKRYDLLHFFNIIRPTDILLHIRKSQKPFVISPVYVDYSEYERSETSRVRKVLSNTISKHGIEYVKAIARWIRNGEKIASKSYLFRGHKTSIRYILKKAACLLPNSQSELNRLEKDFNRKLKARIIPNAIDTSLFQTTSLSEKDPELVICAARIEGRKNQLNLIRALNNTSYKLLIIGKPAPNHKDYFEQCKSEAAENISFIDEVSQEELLAYYRKAAIHAMPSWFETTGLSSLEAAYCGCKLVVGNRGDERDYFGTSAWYCDPGSETSIREAVSRAAAAPFDTILKEKITLEFTWEHTAMATLEAYKEVLACA